MINTKSIDNPDAKRKEHLKHSYFFDVEKDKQVTFINNTLKKRTR
jgi:polyisoprenoid-binding protein YceI